MLRRSLLVVGLLSSSLLALELIWTRLFSAEFYYPFAFLTLSLAILGLGLGALSVRAFPWLAREESVPVALLMCAVAMLAGLPLVFKVAVEYAALLASWGMVGKFALTLGLLTAAFFFGGIALAALFRANSSEMPRVYMADLLGAGSGVVVAIVLMDAVGTPAATFLTALPVLVATFLAARRWMRAAPVVAVFGMVGLCLVAGGLLELPRTERAPIIYRHWDAMAKIKLYDFGEARAINIDNAANTTAAAFDGK
jgi:hypothetical protein